MAKTKTCLGLKPGFVEVGKRRMVIMEEREYDRLLDIVDAAEARDILASSKDKLIPWEKVKRPVVGNRIAQVRRSLSMTQKALAKRMKVKQSTISRIEKPDANLTLGTLQKLAGIFGCSVHQIISEGAGGQR